MKDPDCWREVAISSINMTIRHEITLSMKEDSTVEDLLGRYCRRLGMEENTARLLLNGERLDKKSKLAMLKMEEDDVIDSFLECRGGGPLPKKSKLNSEQIIDALNISFDDMEFSKDKSSKELREKDEEMVDTSKEHVMQDEVSFDKDQTKCDNDFQSNAGKQEETDEDDVWMGKVREEFNKGNLEGNSDIHKRLKFFLNLPTLAKCEQNIVRSLIGRIEIHSEWEEEKNNNFPELNMLPKKRKGNPEKVSKSHKRKKVESGLNNEGEESFENPDQRGMRSSPNLHGNTPKQRKNLFQLFGIVSPFLRAKVPTEEEVRRFSLAVHLWAGKMQGSVGFLLKNRLNDRHFKDIMVFAGPSSKWKLIPDRSTTQYKNLWQNAFKGEEYFHGDQETGFESKNKIHEASLSSCPFGHCMLSPALMDITCEKTTEKTKTESNVQTSSRRRLFTPNKESSNELQRTVNPSPTKQELKEQNRLLEHKVSLFMSKQSEEKSNISESHKKDVSLLTKPKVVIKCQQEGCEKTFQTVFGLVQHSKKMHLHVENIKKVKQECPFCGKATFYVDKHIKSSHKEMSLNNKCEVCKQEHIDMKKHRSICIFCPFCGYQNKKKERLLKHIAKNHREILPQEQPLDMRTPKKVARMKVPQEVDVRNINETIQAEPLDLSPQSKNEDNVNQNGHTHVEEPLDLSHLKSHANKKQNQNKEEGNRRLSIELDREETFNSKRTKYPFDDGDEAYESEYEKDDEKEFTSLRRTVKDEIEIKLRRIDGLDADDVLGDEDMLEQFESFMRNKTRKVTEEECYQSDVSTVRIYTQALKNDVFPALHKLFEPFDARWLINCTEAKECTFEGEKRFYVKPEEPIYITSKIVQTALDMSKGKGGQQGGQRGTILNSIIQLMNFIEIFFNQKLNVYGREPFENVVMYHQGVRTFISGTGAWKMCNDEKDKAQNENKVRQSYQHPNKEVEVLQRYKKFIGSPIRLKNLNKILIHSDDEGKKPSDKGIVELGNIVMGEIEAATGCRPVVLLKLTTGAYVDKQPGFNPYKISKDDCIVDEEDGDDKIYRRVNPNLPPKSKACQHQLEENVAECPVMCADRCIPDGYNLYITWDKTSSSKGPSYLHIPKELKHLMDIYDIKRIRYFKGRKSPFSKKEGWIHDDSTPFFLNSACAPFKQLDLKHLSAAMGIHVTAYNYRKIVATWALSHASEEIRFAEQEALQHTLRVANQKYKQNKQINPQKLTQKYVEEEGLFPEAFKEDIEKTQSKVKSAIKTTEDQRTEKRIEKLLKRKEAYQLLRSDNKPLGPKYRILKRKQTEFLDLVQRVNEMENKEALVEMKPLQWRQFCVRTVCTAKEENGQQLRSLWAEMYEGDLKWGVRDVRKRAEADNWQATQVTRRRDRNSWIAACIRQGLKTDQKKQEKAGQKCPDI